MRQIHREILALALPAIVSNVTTPLLGLVDVAVVGHIGSSAYIGAIAVGGSIFNMLYWVFNFLRMGSSGMTAQAYGAGDGCRAETILWRALFIAACISLMLIAFSRPIAAVILSFMDAEPETNDLALRYFNIVIMGAPAVLGTYALSGWFLGMQDSRSPMWIAIATNIVNIAISLVLVIALHFKIEGVAVGTVTAQWIGFMIGMVIVTRRYRISRPRWHDMVKLEELKHFFSINIDIFLRTVCLAAVTIWFTKAGAGQGPDILAANALLMQFFMLFSFFMDGFAFAGEALSGKYMGMGDKSMLKAGIYALFRWSFAVALLFSSAYIVAGDGLLSILTDNRSLLSTADHYMPWAIIIPIAGVTAFTWDGIFIGMTLTRLMLKSMLISMILFFTSYFLLIDYWGNHALWLSFILYLVSRGFTQSILFKRKHIMKDI